MARGQAEKNKQEEGKIRRLFAKWDRPLGVRRRDPRFIKDQRAYYLHGDPEDGYYVNSLRAPRRSARKVRKIWAQQQGPKWVIYALAAGMYEGEAMVIAVVYFKQDVSAVVKALRAIR